MWTRFFQQESQPRCLRQTAQRKEKHPKVVMCGILHLTNWQNSMELTFYSSHFSTSVVRNRQCEKTHYHQPQSQQRGSHRCPYEAYTCIRQKKTNKKKNIMIEIHMKDTPGHLTAQRRSPAGHCRCLLSASTRLNCGFSPCRFLRTCSLSWTDIIVLLMCSASYLSQTNIASAHKNSKRTKT